jgi:hypothetical protein
MLENARCGERHVDHIIDERREEIGADFCRDAYAERSRNWHRLDRVEARC